MAVVTIHCDFGAQENQICHYFHFFPIYLPWTDGTGCHDLNFYFNVEFQASFSLSSFTLIFSSSSLSAIWVVSSAYLRLLIFLLAILIPRWKNKIYPKNTLFTFNSLVYLGNPNESIDKLVGTNNIVQQADSQQILKINSSPSTLAITN